MKRARGRRGVGIVADAARVEASLWRRLRFEGQPECREQLFDRHRPLARTVAARQGRLRGGDAVERGDLEQFAYEGLLEAIDRFDPLRGTPFAAFARRRIGGCIASGAARLSEIGTQLSHRGRVRAERLRTLRGQADGGDTADPLRAVADLAAHLAIGLVLEGTSLIADEASVDPRPDAYQSLAWRELQAILRDGIAGLPPREATIVRQHYQNGISFAQIAALLGVSRGRVSQLHASALGRLRARIGSGRGRP